MATKQAAPFRVRTAQPIQVGAILTVLLAGMLAANVWLVLISHLPAGLALTIEIVLLLAFLGWAIGKGPPTAMHDFRARIFRNVHLRARQWGWGCIAAVAFAATVNLSLALLFRLVPYPAAAFRHGYDLSFLPSYPVRWLVVVVSAASAAICEETAFRGALQKPLELRWATGFAVCISSLAFTVVHLNQAWALPAMIPIVFGAGLLLGLIAHATDSLLPGMIGHFIMDVALFAYWWTGIAGEFRGRPIQETGMDAVFFLTCGAFAVFLAAALFALAKLTNAVNARATPISAC
jgi:membrane protease YdiL (CAAX protease family)